MPSSELVDAYLAEITKSYGVAWPGYDAAGGDSESGTKVSKINVPGPKLIFISTPRKRWKLL